MHYRCTLYAWLELLEKSQVIWAVLLSFSSFPHVLFMSTSQCVWLARWLGWCWLENKMTKNRTSVRIWSMAVTRLPFGYSTLSSSICHIFYYPSKIKLFHLASILSFQKKYIDVLVILPFIGGNFEKIARLPLGRPKIMLKFNCNASQRWMMWGMN